MELINSFKRYLINTVPKIVVKDRVVAEAAETMTSRRNGDYYVADVGGGKWLPVPVREFPLTYYKRLKDAE